MNETHLGYSRQALRAWFAAGLLVVAGCATSPAATPGTAATQDAATGTANEAAPTTVTQAVEPLADPRVLGASDAPVSIIEFTDLQCPYCARFALETWPALKARYVDTGKVRYAARDLPLPFHANALPAAVAARCAGEQGKFFEYREALFRGQAHLTDAPYDAIAGRFGLDVARFAKCRAEPRILEAVKADAALAARNGIASTPTFVIGREVDGQFVGEVMSGAQPLEAFATRIDALLHEAR